MRRLCEDITRRHPAFRHIGMDRVAVAFAQARRRVSWGLQAKLTPMRFEHGSLFMDKGGERWTVQRLVLGDLEILYILTFYLPRFLEQSYQEKLTTVFHEMFHISQKFDGDVRRLRGTCYLHSGSQAAYDRQMSVFAQEYLDANPARERLAFLEQDFRSLQNRHGRIVGLQVPIPRLIPAPLKKSA